MAWLIIGTLIMILTFLALAEFLWRRLRQRNYDVPARDIRKGHHWVMVVVFPRDTTYCVISEERIVEGAFCDSCGICVADQFVQVCFVNIYDNL